jgi:hypothetical protein
LRTGDWLRRCAPWLDQATADRLVARAIARPIRWNADTLAQRLNLTSEERDRQAKEAKRRAAGARPQALSTSRTKPWIALGISRSKWYADRRAVREREMSGQFRRQYKTGSTVDGIVHTIDGSKAPEVVGSRSDSPACQMSPLGQPLEQGGSPADGAQHRGGGRPADDGAGGSLRCRCAHACAPRTPTPGLTLCYGPAVRKGN